MQLYLLLDTSGSMEGAKIGALNDAMDNIVVDLQEKASNGVDIEVSVLSFARHINWMYKDPVNISDFTWKPLSVGGMTSLGEACCVGKSVGKPQVRRRYCNCVIKRRVSD